MLDTELLVCHHQLVIILVGVSCHKWEGRIAAGM